MENEKEKQQHYVVIENLKEECSEEDISNNLLYLFNRLFHLNVEKTDILIKRNKSREAVIKVAKDENLESYVKKLTSPEERSKLQFNFLSIINPDVDIKAQIVNNHSLSKTLIEKNERSFTEKENHCVVTEKTYTIDTDNSIEEDVKEVKEEKSDEKVVDPKQSKIVDKSKEKQNSHRKVNQSIKYLSDAWGVRSLKTTSFRNQGPNKQKGNERCYMEGETLGKQCLKRSFVDGEGDIAEFLVNIVPKYVCGFLNSNHSGTLYIGVTDDGCVSGLRCDRSNDIIQQTISEAIAVIKPPITSRGYNVTLVPVFDKFGGLKETRIETYKVIEVSVERTINLYQLYEVNGEVFNRKDGAHYCMKPTEIQEWYHIKQLHLEELENALRRQKLDNESTKEFEMKNYEMEKEAEIKALTEEQKAQFEAMKEEKTKELHEALEHQRLQFENKNKDGEGKILFEKGEEIKRLQEEMSKELKTALEAQRLEYETKIDNERNKMYSDKEDEIKEMCSKKDDDLQKALDAQKSEYEEKLELEKTKITKTKQGELDKIKEEKDKEISELKSKIEEMKSEKPQVKSKTCTIM